MIASCDRSPNLTALAGEWAEPLSIRQVYDAVARKPLLFSKAAKTILLWELAVAERDPNPADVYRNIPIELAVCRIGGVVIGLDRQYRMTSEAEAVEGVSDDRSVRDSEPHPCACSEGKRGHPTGRQFRTNYPPNARMTPNPRSRSAIKSSTSSSPICIRTTGPANTPVPAVRVIFPVVGTARLSKPPHEAPIPNNASASQNAWVASGVNDGLNSTPNRLQPR